jgi:hypothetical protein
VRALLAAALAAAAVAVADCGQKAAEYGGTAENRPVRDLRIMAPAEPSAAGSRPRARWPRRSSALAQPVADLAVHLQPADYFAVTVLASWRSRRSSGASCCAG